MKKSLFFAGLAMIVGLTFTSCDNKKPAASVEEQATGITEELKADAIEIFKNVKISNDVMLQEIEVLPEGVRIVPVKFFLPLDWADKAQTVEQKCAMLGCYTVDAQFDKLVYGSRNETEARRAVIAKLFTEANVSSEPINVDSIASLGREDYIAAIQDLSLKNFEASLENNEADNQVRVLLYSVVETTLNQTYVNEQRGEYDQMAMIQDMKKNEKAMSGIVKLIELLSPYYESLSTLAPVTEKIKAVLEAKTENDQDAAYLTYNGYIKELRGKLNASMEE